MHIYLVIIFNVKLNKFGMHSHIPIDLHRSRMELEVDVMIM